MREIIIHPRRNFIIRQNTLPGMEEQMCLDEVKRSKKTGKLRHNKTVEAVDNISKEEMLEKFRGTGKGRGTIPDDGWVKVEVEDDTQLTDIFAEAQKQVKEQNFV